MNIYFSQYQWMMVIGTMIVCFLLAILVRASLRRRARLRLQGND
jgi:cellulose synthase (UDP-forming)